MMREAAKHFEARLAHEDSGAIDKVLQVIVDTPPVTNKQHGRLAVALPA